MDMLENDINIEPPKVTEETVNYDAQNMSSNWHLTSNKNTSIGMGNNPMVEPSSCMVDSFCPQIFDQPIHGTNWYPNVVLRENMFPSSVPRMVPPSLPHFPSESSFIERAVRFSCFDGGHFSQLGNPFSNLDPSDHYSHPGLMRNPNEGFVGNELKASVREVFEETQNGVDSLGTTRSDGAEFSGRGNEAEFEGTGGEFSGKGIGLKKRKRNEQKTVNNENNEAEQPADESGPGGKGPSPDKEEYIHVRARRGQATNSHSLAERIRREKISERMKFLQDLVPGCSKVTGKAVMLDEIINYVQSLQRQVEFLSMKLATVNPRLDFNIEGYLAKDILQTRAGLSASLGFPPDMTMHFPHNIHPSPPAGVIHSTLHGETLHKPVCYQTNVVSRGFREPTSQAPCVWDDELHNVINNGFNLSAPPNSSDLSGRMKAEP